MPATATAARLRKIDHATVVKRVEHLQANLEECGIAFDSEARTFRHNGRTVPGLTTPLRRFMWPDYKFDVANKASSRRLRLRDPAIKRIGDGRARGTRVHKQIELLTNGGAAAMKRRGEKLQPYVAKLLLAFREWNWIPIASEVPLIDDENMIATAADLLCSAPGGRLVLVEIKTGYYGTWDRFCKQMRAPLAGVLSDSPRSQALVQLALTKRMIELRGTKVDAAYVIRADASGIAPESIIPKLHARTNLVAARVGEAILASRKRRKRPS